MTNSNYQNTATDAETEVEHPGLKNTQGLLAQQLDLLEQQIVDLKVRYEQHFMGVVAIAPTKEHDALKRTIAKLIRAPFKNATIRFRLRTIESRYHLYNTYWERVSRERENGTYFRDVFKADMRDQAAAAEAKSQTVTGKASKQISELFNSYKQALEKQTGKAQDLNYDSFHRSLLARAKDLKAQHGAKSVSFKIGVKDGKVTVKATAKK